MTSRLDRRVFLAAGLAAMPAALFAGAVGVGAATGTCGGASSYSQDAIESALRIGRHYLNAGLDLQERVRLLESAGGREEDFLAYLYRQLSDLDDRVRRDFEVDETVTCDGWVLARAEARLCAQIALRSMPPTRLAEALQNGSFAV